MDSSHAQVTNVREKNVKTISLLVTQDSTSNAFHCLCCVMASMTVWMVVTRKTAHSIAWTQSLPAITTPSAFLMGMFVTEHQTVLINLMNTSAHHQFVTKNITSPVIMVTAFQLILYVMAVLTVELSMTVMSEIATVQFVT
jgi:hypothetical protein